MRRGYSSSARQVSDLRPPPSGPAPGARPACPSCGAPGYCGDCWNCGFYEEDE